MNAFITFPDDGIKVDDTSTNFLLEFFVRIFVAIFVGEPRKDLLEIKASKKIYT